MRLLGKIIRSPWLLCPLFGLLLLVASLVNLPILLQLEYPLYDQLLQFRPVPENDRVVLITTDQLPQTAAPILQPSDDLTAIIVQIDQLGGKQIALLSPAEFNLQTSPDELATANILSTMQITVAAVAVRGKTDQQQQLPSSSLIPTAAQLRSPQQLLFKLQNPLADYKLGSLQQWWFSDTPLNSDQTLPTGHLIFSPDADGKIRSQATLFPWQQQLLPSLPLQLAIQAHTEKLSQLQLGSPQLSGNLRVGRKEIPVLSNYRSLLNIYPRQLPFERYSSLDLLHSKLPPYALQDKIVLIGPINSYGDHHEVAGYGSMSTSELAAIATATLLDKSPPHRPDWAWLVEAAILLYFTAILLLLVPKLSLRAGFITVALFLIGWLAICAGALIVFSLWLKCIPAILLCGLGFPLVRWHMGSSEQYQQRQENYKILAQRFLEQGLLDLALEKALLVEPRGKANKTMLYNLGIEFERKRMPHNAVTIYNHLLRSGRFRDTKTRLRQLHKIDRISQRPANDDATVVLTPAGEKPTLGRYRIESELGQGAMGTVYLGIDPKINRQVAIKTLAYQQMAAEELTDIKERFFREAEAAGNLSHPNIVTIYDVGEEADLAFFAMELLEGKDLGCYCQPKKLLPVAQVINIIAQTAAALDYAHQQGVVHRDIKPTNIVLGQGDQVKVTDFGIARITSTSQTETGIILGTPSYMSPEQVAGKKVDGRSDLFSLGVVMYELLSGTKPFTGEGLTALMYNISTVNYQRLPKVCPDLPPRCYPIVDKLLQKTLTRRYKSAAAVQQELQALLEELGQE